MSYVLEFTDTALHDYKISFEWYSEIDPSLAQSFEKEIDGILHRICETPEQFPIVESETRRSILKRFPYGVFFLIDGNKIIVTSILHHRREPKKRIT